MTPDRRPTVASWRPAAAPPEAPDGGESAEVLGLTGAGRVVVCTYSARPPTAGRYFAADPFGRSWTVDVVRWAPLPAPSDADPVESPS